MMGPSLANSQTRRDPRRASESVRRKLALNLVLLAIGAALLARRNRTVVIDDAGIRDSMLPVGTIGWDEVRGASVQEIGPTPVVALQVCDPERFIRRLPPARQFIARKAVEAGLPGLYLTLVGADGNPHAIRPGDQPAGTRQQSAQ